MTTDPFTEAARAEAEAVMREARERVGITVQEQTRYVEGYVAGAEWAASRERTQEDSVLMTSREETISDRLSDAGYTEHAEDEDGGVTWVSAPLGEVLRIVSAAQEATDEEVLAAAWAVCRLEDGGYEPTEDHPCKACTESARAALTAVREVRSR